MLLLSAFPMSDLNLWYQVVSKYFLLTTMDTLPDDILLEIFDHYRLVCAGDWPRLQGWYKLAHMCRRWRRLVFASSLRLNLQLRCTFRMRVIDMINYSPPFPLVLDYGPRLLKTWTPEDEDGLLFALLHLSRANEIMLSAPQSTLAEMTAAMIEAAPRLEYLTLHSQCAEFVLPKSFLDGDAPQLRHLILSGVSLATLHPLLPSATSLVSLVLEGVPPSAYFSPDSLVAHIRSMPLLQTLSIGFLSAVPRPGFRGERFLPPGQIPRVELPALTQLIYRGVSAYIEALLARIRTPLVQDIDITLFNQLTLRLPRISAFIHDLESFQPTRARVDFAESSAHVIVVSAPDPAPQPSAIATESPDVSLSVSCARLDFQVSAMAQICNGLSSTGAGVPAHHHHLLPIEELTLGFHQGEQQTPTEQRDHDDEVVVDPELWRALLSPFRRVRTLRVHVALAALLESALRSRPSYGPAVPVVGDQQQQQMLLPELRTVVLLHGDRDDERAMLASTSEALNALVDERDRAGHPVNVEPQDLSKLSWRRSQPVMKSSSSLHKKGRAAIR